VTLFRSWKLALALVVAATGWAAYLQLRDVSILRVRHVEIAGLEKGDAPAIRRALRQTGSRMTVLHVRQDELERAVDAFPVVRSVTASVDFPSTLRIEVNRQVPVAVLTTAAGRRAAVAADGTLLPRVDTGRLATVRARATPAGGALEENPARAIVAVLGEAPPELRPLLARAYATDHGIRVAIRQGPVLRFGGPDQAAAKWAAATRVLADPGSKGASFVDLRLPQRPVAGGLPPSPEEAAASAGEATTSEALGQAAGEPAASGAAAAGTGDPAASEGATAGTEEPYAAGAPPGG
jgi:cell division protein FtsQ